MEKLPQHILFVLFYRKTDCILKEQIVQYFLIRENLQDQSTHKSKNIRLGATIDGLVRKEKYELPPEAIREILFLVCIRLSVVEMGLKSNTWIL